MDLYIQIQKLLDSNNHKLIKNLNVTFDEWKYCLTTRLNRTGSIKLQNICPNSPHSVYEYNSNGNMYIRSDNALFESSKYTFNHNSQLDFFIRETYNTIFLGLSFDGFVNDRFNDKPMDDYINCISKEHMNAYLYAISIPIGMLNVNAWVDYWILRTNDKLIHCNASFDDKTIKIYVTNHSNTHVIDKYQFKYVDENTIFTLIEYITNILYRDND